MTFNPSKLTKDSGHRDAFHLYDNDTQEYISLLVYRSSSNFIERETIERERDGYSADGRRQQSGARSKNAPSV